MTILSCWNPGRASIILREAQHRHHADAPSRRPRRRHLRSEYQVRDERQIVKPRRLVRRFGSAGAGGRKLGVEMITHSAATQHSHHVPVPPGDGAGGGPRIEDAPIEFRVRMNS
jgi:hypothetical protein